MAASELTIKIHVERQGLLLKVRELHGALLMTIDLAEKLGLSEEGARELAARLDERDRQEAEEAH